VDIGSVGAALLVVAGGPLLLASLYLVLLALAALRGAPRTGRGDAASTIAVLVPAHDEEALVRRCVESLRAQDYPAGRLRIVVVADNCGDATAEVARRAGAEVMVRDDPTAPGKGRALRWAMDRLMSEPHPVDAVAVVDADSVAEGGMLRALEASLAAGAEVAQGDYTVLDDGTPGSRLRQAAFLLFHRARFSGRAALGLPCSLVGNGMIFRRSLLERHPWTSFTGAEDLEQTVELRLAGVRPRYEPGAMVAGPASAFGRGAATQRMRWEGGRFHVVRGGLPRLLTAAGRRRDLSLLDAAIDLAVPPLGLLALAGLVGGAGTLAAVLSGAVPPWAGATWWATSVLLTVYVMVGLRAAHAPAPVYRSLLQTPRFLLLKVGTYLRLTHGLRAERWERTERPSDVTAASVEVASRGEGDAGAIPPAPARVRIAGVPIDIVDASEAVERMIVAGGGGRVLQVSTVNLQFLVTARRLPEVRRALCGSGLNVADGAPVMWLARILGRPLPERVAGADLVPLLMRRAAAAGARVYLLGGTGGVAERAAQVLTAANPGLAIAGIHEPPLTPLDAMDDGAILERIRAAGADILLVGFGHPKQDLWIARNRDRLPVGVAIGVGGTFDLIAGRLRRAPAWARGRGLEWVFRLAQEPRRLALRYAACAAWLLGVLMPLAAWQRVMGASVLVHPPEGLVAEPSQDGALS
jgi:exopolysaccharide biosynthesis WecB/TagA/CpsF family protein